MLVYMYEVGGRGGNYGKSIANFQLIAHCERRNRYAHNCS